MNTALFIGETIFTFSLVIAFFKLFGKSGLYVWMAIATCFAQIGTAKTITFFDTSCTAGCVLFASTYLVTDILNEVYSEKEARRAVYIGFTSVLAFVISMAFINYLKPADSDTAASAISALFGIVPRISAASIVMYFISNLLDVKLFNIIKKITCGKHMWLRNNAATIVCNGGENFLFLFLAFAGQMPVNLIFSIALSATVVETIVAVCDTPFLYAAKKIKVTNEV